MQTNFSHEFLSQPNGARANEILRSCVHCGFCNATCPTYQLTGDELDGPRGRIYLIRDLLEAGENSPRAQNHLDRCLTCRACETTCPSGVAYGELAEIARNTIGPQREGLQGLYRRVLSYLIPKPKVLQPLVSIGRWFKWMLPHAFAKQIPATLQQSNIPENKDAQVLLLQGCAQQVSTANTNNHLAALLKANDIAVTVDQKEVCCGALDLHMGDEAKAINLMQENVGNLSAYQTVVSSASGCGVTYKEYGRLLGDKAREFSTRVVDVSEYLTQLIKAGQFVAKARYPEKKVAWHSPCTLQHGQQVVDQVEQILTAAGYQLVTVADAHLCCGSAGTYSILQPELSEQLQRNKVRNLQKQQPDYIATANVGCQTQIAQAADVPVLHWIELLE